MLLLYVWRSVAFAAQILLPVADIAEILPEPDATLEVDANGQIAVGAGGRMIAPVSAGQIAPELLEVLLLEAPILPRVRLMVDRGARAGDVRTAIAAAAEMNATILDIASGPDGSRGFTLNLAPDVEAARALLDAPGTYVPRMVLHLGADLAVLGRWAPAVLHDVSGDVDWPRLSALLDADRHSASPTVLFTLNADDDVPWSRVFATIAAARRHGYSEFALSGQPPAVRRESAPEAAFPPDALIPTSVRLGVAGTFEVTGLSFSTIPLESIARFGESCGTQVCVLAVDRTDGPPVIIGSRTPSNDPARAWILSRSVIPVAGLVLPPGLPVFTGVELPPLSLFRGPDLVLGSIDKHVIDGVIRQHLAQISRCYQAELSQDPGLAGRVDVRFVITSIGSVPEVRFDSDLGSARMDQCIASVFHELAFPAPSGRGSVLVKYPFVFAPE